MRKLFDILPQKKVTGMYRKNDIVMYAAQGVCKITDITKKEFNDELIEYYVLKPVYSENALIYVPTGSESLMGKMRHVLSEEEIYEIIRKLPDENAEWIENEHVRKEQYRQILSQGDRKALIGMIKALYYHKQGLLEKGKKLHVSDERFFKEAERILYDEFALVLNIETDQVLPFILEQLEPKAKA